MGTINQGDELPRTMSTIWLHELAHIWTDIEDLSKKKPSSDGKKKQQDKSKEPADCQGEPQSEDEEEIPDNGKILKC